MTITPNRARRIAAGMGTLSLAIAAGGVLAPAASADVCGVTDRGATCGPAAGTPTNDGKAFATAQPGQSSAQSQYFDSTGLSSGAGAYASSPSGASAAATATDERAAAASANSSPDVVPSESVASTDPSRARAGAEGVGAASGSAVSGSSTADSDARGTGALSVSAANDHSTSTARSSGTSASSAAGAGKDSIATANATGTGSTARAAAYDHDHAYAVATNGGIADISRTNAHCRGGVTFGFEDRSPSVCTSAGPVGVGFSTVTGPDIGLAGLDLTPAGYTNRQRA